MRPRAYAISLMALAAIMFSGIVAANVALDPQLMLGTRLIGEWRLPNDRYRALQTYLDEPNRYDGLRFGSSRAPAIRIEQISRDMEGARFADFAVYGGQIPDHLTVLEYVVRQTTALKGNKIRAVFLLLDLDLFVVPTIGNSAMHTLWHPAVTGETRVRFMWRYLTAIQFQAWRTAFRSAWMPGQAGHQPAQALGIAAQPATLPAKPMNRITVLPAFERQIAMLRRFVEICSSNDIQLVVALSPLHRSNAARYEPSDLDRAVQRVGEVVPVWDFESPDWLSGRPDLWHDLSHFTADVGDMMLDLIFSRPAARADFGRRRSGL